jgi:hypothetical protein
MHILARPEAALMSSSSGYWRARVAWATGEVANTRRLDPPQRRTMAQEQTPASPL